jgi:8-oxo-dGTP pyrophosphatase MutT (NUDIX family)
MIKCLSSKLVYENAWMKVREDQVEFPNGHRGIYGVAEKTPCALVMPYERGGFHLVRQYRYTVAAPYWEFPQGSFYREKISPLENAVRELKEETGFSAERMESLGSLFVAYGFCDQTVDIYLAENLSPGPKHLEETEQGLECRWFSRKDFEAMCDRGEIRDSLSVAAYGLFCRKRA